MNSTFMIDKIAKKDFNLNDFVRLAINDPHARGEIVQQMLTNPAIMVYYHCFYVVENASREEPALFYPYWDVITELLHHKNSYHRDFALEILSNLAKVDHEDRFSEIEKDYFDRINDEKFMTGNCCLKNMLKIYRHKPEYREEIIDILLDIDHRCDYTEKQKGLLKADILEIFEQVYDGIPRRDEIESFIKAEVNSISLKSRKKAKALIKKYNL